MLAPGQEPIYLWMRERPRAGPVLKIFQVGAYPPPYGGVTVHLMRLHDHLRREGMDSTIIDLSPGPKRVPGVLNLSWPEADAYLAGSPRSVVHFHAFDPAHAWRYARLSRRHVTVLSLHNERFGQDLEAVHPLRRLLARRRLRRLHCVVVDSEHCKKIAARVWGENADIRLIPEFIPPAEIPALDHPGLAALRARCRHLLASSAWRVSFHDGQDLYGLDMLVELLRRLVHDRQMDVGLAVLLPTVGDEAYFGALTGRVESLGLGARCLFVNEPIVEASSLWREADLVIRATNTDGNSLTVQEALALGVPVVASDCVERPAGALLFRTRDQDDLTDRVARLLADRPPTREPRPAGAGNAPAFVALYEDLGRKWRNGDV